MNDRVVKLGPRRYVRAKELARILGISVGTIRKHTMHPECPAIKPDGCRVVLYEVGRYQKWLLSGGAAAARAALKARRRAA